MIFLFLSILTAGWAQTSARPAAVPAPAKKPTPVVAVKPDIALGKKAYMAVCIQCHNRDPNKKGNLGPELVDSPLEIMQHKVAHGVYPAVLPKGFVPKRKTKVMRKLPNAVKDVVHIYAWIQSVKAKK